MREEEWIAMVCGVVRVSTRKRFADMGLRELASLERIEALVRALCAALRGARDDGDSSAPRPRWSRPRAPSTTAWKVAGSCA
jgi:hypothetical protein